MEILKTPLYEEHIRCGGKMVEFGGYSLPVQYAAGVIREHMAVREHCGLFDVSHMGEIGISGPGSIAFLNRLLTNDYSGMKSGQARYSPMCREDGGTVDDIIVYMKEPDSYFAVVNAANKDKDFEWMKAHCRKDVVLEDLSDRYAQIALQGPAAADIIRKLVKEQDVPKKYYTADFRALVGEIPCILSRTGYTGEDGFEIYLAPERAAEMWRLLLQEGEEYGLIPCGLGARDTLRLEAGMPLYGHELSDGITPVEAGLGIFVKMDKEDFIGKDALEERGVPDRIRVGLRVTGRGIIREHQEVYDGDRLVGMTTSGTHCPYLGYPVAMALVDPACREKGTALEALVRGRRVAAEVVSLPFYRRS